MMTSSFSGPAGKAPPRGRLKLQRPPYGWPSTTLQASRSLGGLGGLDGLLVGPPAGSDALNELGAGLGAGLRGQGQGDRGADEEAQHEPQDEAHGSYLLWLNPCRRRRERAGDRLPPSC